VSSPLLCVPMPPIHSVTLQAGLAAPQQSQIADHSHRTAYPIRPSYWGPWRLRGGSQSVQATLSAASLAAAVTALHVDPSRTTSASVSTSDPVSISLPPFLPLQQRAFSRPPSSVAQPLHPSPRYVTSDSRHPRRIGIEKPRVPDRGWCG
jgi:hypothetical protein